MSRSAALRRPIPVRVFLVLLVAALVLPPLGFAGVLLDRYAGAERARGVAAAQTTALRAADAVDRELAGLQAALLALATSPALQAGDIGAFDAQVRLAAAALGENIVLSDATGQQLVNTRVVPGSPLPRVGDFAPYQATIEQRAPTVSDLFVGAVSRQPLVVVNVPVLRGGGGGGAAGTAAGQVAYVLNMSLPTSRLTHVIRSQGVPEAWTATIVDGRHRIIARSREEGRFLGQLATADLRAATATGTQGTWQGTTADGAAVLGAFARLRAADWRVAVDVPLDLLEGPLRRGVQFLAFFGLLAVALSSLLAFWLSRRLLRPLRGLTRAARLLGQGEPIPPAPSGIVELDRVSQALSAAADELATRAGALAEQRARLSAIVETAPVGIVLAEAPSGRIVFGNAQAEAIFGHPILPSPGIESYKDWVSHHRDGRRVAAHEYPLARALRGEPRPELECLYTRGDGRQAWVALRGAPIRGADGGITAALVACLDVDALVRGREAQARFAEDLERQVASRTKDLAQANDRLREEIATRAGVEEQLRQAQKMEAVGRLTGGIAHDFNNLLTVVIGSLDLLRRRLPADDGPDAARQRRLVDGAADGAQRAATLTARLLAFSRQQPLAPKPLDLNRLVSDMGELLRRTLGETVALETVLAGGLWQVHADPNQVESALLNLAVNARDAMQEATADPATGRVTDAAATPVADASVTRLTVETGNTYLDEAYARTNQEVSPGQYVMLAVADTGTGMAPDVIARAFDPFFTTKPQGKGTGLGLSQVHGFVKQSGGHVQIYSETRPGPGRGTTVKIYLPRFVAQSSEPPPALEAAPGGGKGELILLVEDEESVRRYSATALAELGYRVLEADRPAAALRLLDANPDIALLFTDVVLPESNGRKLAEEARARRPGLRVLFTTGYTRNAIVHNGELDPGVDLVTKPFTLDRLGAKLREVLDRPAPRPLDSSATAGPSPDS